MHRALTKRNYFWEQLRGRKAEKKQAEILG